MILESGCSFMINKSYILELARMYGIDICEGGNVHTIKDETGYKEILNGDITESFSFVNTNQNSIVEEISMNTKFELIYDDELLEVA